MIWFRSGRKLKFTVRCKRGNAYSTVLRDIPLSYDNMQLLYTVRIKTHIPIDVKI
jgi:hypothetical protein